MTEQDRPRSDDDYAARTAAQAEVVAAARADLADLHDSAAEDAEGRAVAAATANLATAEHAVSVARGELDDSRAAVVSRHQRTAAAAADLAAVEAHLDVLEVERTAADADRHNGGAAYSRGPGRRSPKGERSAPVPPLRATVPPAAEAHGLT